ncbi:hypothetical protein V5799_023979 [Amblyomma americanum]|uniref:Uncharacterized protein n=1 Tax=Amblyomma americanum TaxID=6943 RepID=A0AAQ4EDA9_AMBAM
MGTIGYIEPFDETTSDWRSYEERLKAYLLVNDVPVAKKVPAFLSLIGAKTYALLKSLTAPGAPSSREFDSLLKLLSDHLAPQSSVIAERVKFYKRSQRSGPALLGREWLQDIRLDWKNLVFLMHLGPSREMSKHWQEKLEAMLDSHSELFKDELGTITEEQAKLVLREGSQPKFVKARSVPFALQGAVEAELAKMEKLGIITPVATSEYATPLVPVVKRDGSLRLSGDYKTTVNPCLEVDRYLG